MDDKTLLERAAKAAGMWATDFEICLLYTSDAADDAPRV